MTLLAAICCLLALVPCAVFLRNLALYRAPEARDGVTPPLAVLIPARNEAANIHQPALLLWGRQDAVIDTSAMALFAAKMPQARQVLVDDAGHMSLMEQPAAVADAVVQLIDTAPSTSGH